MKIDYVLKLNLLSIYRHKEPFYRLYTNDYKQLSEIKELTWISNGSITLGWLHFIAGHAGIG